MHLEEYKLSADLFVLDPITKTDPTLDHGW